MAGRPGQSGRRPADYSPLEQRQDEQMEVIDRAGDALVTIERIESTVAREAASTVKLVQLHEEAFRAAAASARAQLEAQKNHARRAARRMGIGPEAA